MNKCIQINCRGWETAGMSALRRLGDGRYESVLQRLGAGVRVYCEIGSKRESTVETGRWQV